MTRVVAARHVLPVTGPPSRDGAVRLSGDRIVAVGPRDAIVREAGEGAAVTDLGEAALLPGLVNAHVHLELSWMGGAEPPAGGWIAWLEDLLARRDSVSAAESEAARVREEMIRAGGQLGIKVPLKVEVGWAKNWQEVK